MRMEHEQRWTAMDGKITNHSFISRVSRIVAFKVKNIDTRILFALLVGWRQNIGKKTRVKC